MDASIFSTGPRANLHCTTLAVAEKLADLIRGDQRIRDLEAMIAERTGE